ncbi:N-methyl-L-tryptophan oxidase [Shinella sp. CPCC 101442]|uniref:N-methyl-L-tryptophan oxidase n=1 Tax=Shinella sp. CPCC 101442 TaxID=2932265 RepID=UPI00215394BC|nr:N-methyl-L-tryptophan oxidase [Shinella sp. CPCC 101442]MCR6503045.1 N-methyl-L-tryptophan oxidase [Shinella sp. CPCC 101442]
MATVQTILDVDYAVIGLGVMGASTLYFLAQSGGTVVGIDAHSPPHGLGASHGGYKVTREAVAEGPAYLHFVRRSNALLRDLEHRYGVSLMQRTGTLIIGSEATGSANSFLRDTVGIAEANGIVHDVLPSNELRRRYPQLIGIADEEAGYLEPDAGFIRPEPLLDLQIALAEQAGAEILRNTAVKRITPVSGGVEIEAEGVLIRARQVVVAAGRWMGELLGDRFDSLLTVSRQRTFTFKVRDAAAYRAERFPTLMWFREGVGGDCATVFPLEGPGEGLKFFVADTEVDARIGQSGDRFFERHVEPFFSGISRELLATEACFYTSTSDHGFLLDWHPDIPGLFLVSACSGHGFKHALGIGETVSAVLTGKPAPDLSAFSLERFFAGLSGH